MSRFRNSPAAIAAPNGTRHARSGQILPSLRTVIAEIEKTAAAMFQPRSIDPAETKHENCKNKSGKRNQENQIQRVSRTRDEPGGKQHLDVSRPGGAEKKRKQKEKRGKESGCERHQRIGGSRAERDREHDENSAEHPRIRKLAFPEITDGQINQPWSRQNNFSECQMIHPRPR